MCARRGTYAAVGFTENFLMGMTGGDGVLAYDFTLFSSVIENNEPFGKCLSRGNGCWREIIKQIFFYKICK